MVRTILSGLLVGLLALGCASSKPALSTRPIKWVDPDNRAIPKPGEVEENQIWDIIDHTFFHQIGKTLDLGWTARRLGNAVGLAEERQADNVNALDEAPNSSWFTNRHFISPMTGEALLRGPGFARPDTAGHWEIVAGKFEGGTAGFTIRDAAGQLYLLKFDSYSNSEMASAAEVIATKMLYAAGYNVPQNSIVYFDPAILQIGPRARVPDGAGRKRPMRAEDLKEILSKITVQPNGQLRCVASKFLEGAPVGVFNYDGVRKDDPNDRVHHQHRRELRGLRVLSSWMNDADRRAANTLDMYVTDEAGRSFVKHYLIDMGSTFGSNNLMPHMPKYGNEYLWDAGNVTKSLLLLGLFRKPWEDPLPMPYHELGYFENETFRAEKWVPTYPNPAFERCTGRDGYWGAKIAMAFSDEDIAACVSAGRYSNPDAAAKLTRLLIARRDMIGRYWFSRVNPLDKFRVNHAGLHFEDLAVKGGLADGATTVYRYVLLDDAGNPIGTPKQQPGDLATLPIPGDLAPGRYYAFEIHTDRGARKGDLAVRVYFYVWAQGRYQVVRVERED